MCCAPRVVDLGVLKMNDGLGAGSGCCVPRAVGSGVLKKNEGPGARSVCCAPRVVDSGVLLLTCREPWARAC